MARHRRASRDGGTGSTCTASRPGRRSARGRPPAARAARSARRCSCFVATVTTRRPVPAPALGRTAPWSASRRRRRRRATAGCWPASPVADPPARAVVADARLRPAPGTGPLADAGRPGPVTRPPALPRRPCRPTRSSTGSTTTATAPAPPRPGPRSWAEVTAPRFPLAGADGATARAPDRAGGVDPELPDRRPRHARAQRRCTGTGWPHRPGGPALDPALTGLSRRRAAAAADRPASGDAEAPRPLLGVARAATASTRSPCSASPDAVHRSWRPPSPSRRPTPPPHEPYPRAARGPTRTARSATSAVAAAELAAPTRGARHRGPRGGGVEPRARRRATSSRSPPTRRSWAGAVEMCRGPATAVALDRPPGPVVLPGPRRRRAERPATGRRPCPWPSPADPRPGRPAGRPDEALVTVHLDLLTLVAARGDVLAVLALPVHGARAAHAAAHADALRAGRDERVLSASARSTTPGCSPTVPGRAAAPARRRRRRTLAGVAAAAVGCWGAAGQRDTARRRPRLDPGSCPSRPAAAGRARQHAAARSRAGLLPVGADTLVRRPGPAGGRRPAAAGAAAAHRPAHRHRRWCSSRRRRVPPRQLRRAVRGVARPAAARAARSPGRGRAESYQVRRRPARDVRGRGPARRRRRGRPRARRCASSPSASWAADGAVAVGETP